MIETYLDPPTGQVHTKMKGMLFRWMLYFPLYTLRNHQRVLPNGDLEFAEVLQILQPEIQQYFEFFAHGGTLGSDRIVYAMRRKDVL